jgi:exodeoxyribonuclease VII small subunit
MSEQGAPETPVEAEATFEELMEALEALTDRLATGDLGIEQAADLYEQAEAIHARARRRLAEVSERIARLGPPAETERRGDPPPDLFA